MHTTTTPTPPTIIIIIIIIIIIMIKQVSEDRYLNEHLLLHQVAKD